MQISCDCRTGTNAKVKSEANGDFGVVMPLDGGGQMGFFITPGGCFE